MKFSVLVNVAMGYWQFFSLFLSLPWQAAENQPALLSLFWKKMTDI
jgi:hypothetical protein